MTTEITNQGDPGTMGFFALVLALLIEHAWPLRHDNRIRAEAVGFAAAIRQAFDGGERRHGLIGWLIVVGLAVLAMLALEWLARSIHPLAVFVLHVVVLYCTIGFRQFSIAFAEIRVALAAGDAGADVERSCRQSMAHTLLVAHRHVLAPLLCYIVIPGALGPVVYRLAELLARHWRDAAAPDSAWGLFAARAFGVIDWIPARFTATGFAIVGNFEEALYCWRGMVAAESGTAADRFDTRALLMAVGSGALGVRLADPDLEQRWAQSARPFDCPGEPALPGRLPAAAALVWRLLLLWLGLYAMITASIWLGG
ncbi:MAG: regulatory signaling modulator protein AmpE [Burkholderiaceae bacterium]